ncbi:hypothetical protein [Yersinia frederiksenii]|uniref:hypothetical protein n=1 Tax=Yersinia frederiksenii TaxID=29484 RepID=UPI001865F22C|nr:hypothetical protein [Yersinia frederiksenii]
MKMNVEETIDCINAVLNLMTHCDDHTEIETIQRAASLGLMLLANLEESLSKKP